MLLFAASLVLWQLRSENVHVSLKYWSHLLSAVNCTQGFFRDSLFLFRRHIHERHFFKVIFIKISLAGNSILQFEKQTLTSAH